MQILEKVGLRAELQILNCVSLDNQIVGEFVADILVAGLIIVELKLHEIQLVNYLVALKQMLVYF